MNNLPRNSLLVCLGERAQATARAKSEFLLGTDTASGPDAFQSISQHDYVEYPGLQKPHEVRPQGELSVNREGSLYFFCLLRHWLV